MDSPNSRWWEVVETIVDGMVDEGMDIDFFDGTLKSDLGSIGFNDPDIDRACDWLERASLSGNLTEVLAMIQSRTFEGLRIANPLEIASFSSDLWRRLELCRQKGILSEEMIERLLEGIRTLDTRDWDEEEVSVLLTELYSLIAPGSSTNQFTELLEGRSTMLYC